MKVVDANVLLYATSEDAQHHERSRPWLDAAMSGAESVGFAWLVITAFLRLATSPAVLPQPLVVEDALNVVDLWLGQPSAVVLEPTPRHVALLRGLLQPLGTGGNLVSDAHLAALVLAA